MGGPRARGIRDKDLRCWGSDTPQTRASLLSQSAAVSDVSKSLAVPKLDKELVRLHRWFENGALGRKTLRISRDRPSGIAERVVRATP